MSITVNTCCNFHTFVLLPKLGGFGTEISTSNSASDASANWKGTTSYTVYFNIEIKQDSKIMIRDVIALSILLGN